MPASKRTIWLSASQLAAFAIAAFAFVYWAPWTASLPTEEAARRYPGQVNPAWRSVRIEHGRVKEWRHGTPRQNPVAYGLCTIVFLSGMTYLLATIIWLDRRRKLEPNEPPKPP
jgi:hypothetical protein